MHDVNYPGKGMVWRLGWTPIFDHISLDAKRLRRLPRLTSRIPEAGRVTNRRPFPPVSGGGDPSGRWALYADDS